MMGFAPLYPSYKSLSGDRDRHALALEHLDQLAGGEHLADDVAAADEFALHIKLGDGRPLGEFLDPLAQSRVGQDVDALEGDIEMVQHLDHGGGEAALREDRRALHEQHHVVGADLMLDLLENRVVAHLCLLYSADVCSASACNSLPIRPFSAA